ncbi:MAG TPA: LmeA family phospholipid-binding protein [Candidatus Nanopelagicales bacterium]
MKQFLLGVACTLAVLIAGVLILVLSLGTSAPTAASRGPSAMPSGAPTQAPQPVDLQADETWLGAAELRSQDVVSADGTLADVVARGSGVRFSDEGLRADQLAIDATIPFATVAEQVGDGVTVYDAGQGLAGVQRTITVLGREVQVRATGTVTADGGQLLIQPETVELFGASFLDSAASALARSLVTIRQPVAGVPQSMALTSVSVTPEGFDASLVGRDVVIAQ